MNREKADIEQVLGLLYSHNADVNIRSLREGDTALHLAVKRFDGDDAITLSLKLLSLGLDPDYRNDVSRVKFLCDVILKCQTGFL